MFAALDEADGHVLESGKHAGDGGDAGEGVSVGDVDLGDELLAAAAGHLIGHAGARGQYARKDERDIGKAEGGHDRRRHGELEKADHQPAGLLCDAGGQQVGRCADQSRGAAEQRRETERHQDFRRGNAPGRGDRGDDGQEHHHDRRVVDHGAGHHRAEKNEDDRAHAGPPAISGDQCRRPLERVGLEQALTDDEHREDGDQGLIGEAGKNFVGAERALDAEEQRPEPEQDKPGNEGRDRNQLDRPTLQRIGDDHRDDRRE